jgi:hypothetical protein
MTYNPIIPQATDNLSTSQGQMLTNFGQLNSQFGVDHFPFNDGGVNGTGFHQQVNIPQTIQDTSTAVPTLAGTAGQLFTQTSTNTSTHSEPFWANSQGGMDQVMWYGGLTSLSTLTGAVQFDSGAGAFLRLPNSFQIVWGTASGSSSGSTITFPTPFLNACFAVVVTRNSSSAPSTVFGVSNLTNTTFKLGQNTGTTSCNYIAIGY